MNTHNKRSSNPVLEAACEAAMTKIDGFEAGTDSFNPLAAEQLRDGNPQTINQIRKNRQKIKAAREALSQLK